MTERWCVLLASRQSAAQINRAPMSLALERARSVVAPDKIAAVHAAPTGSWQEFSLDGFDCGNVFFQPRHLGTAFEVLFALLRLEKRLSPATPVLFLPVDHVVLDETVMTHALESMIHWISREPRPIYLLGAVPQGPHNELGYIVPWHDTLNTNMPTSVYEFVERPDIHQARKLINAGALWNTFIFGGTFRSLLGLFVPRFDAVIANLRAAHQPDALARVYDRSSPLDFSQDVLATRIDQLHVLPLPSCGWWPVKPPSPADESRVSEARAG